MVWPVATVLAIGASRGIGIEAVRAAFRAGHSVRALARSAASMPTQDANLDKVSLCFLARAEALRGPPLGPMAVFETSCAILAR